MALSDLIRNIVLVGATVLSFGCNQQSQIVKDAERAGITVEEQKKYLELGVRSHYTEGLARNNITPAILKIIIEREGLDNSDIWCLGDSFNKFKDVTYSSRFDGPKYVKWSSNDFDIPTMWTCWDSNTSLENAIEARELGIKDKDMIAFMNKGGELNDAIASLKQGKSIEYILNNIPHAERAVTEKDKRVYAYYRIADSYEEMKILKSKGIDSEVLIVNEKPASLHFDGTPKSIIGDIRGPTNHCNGKVTEKLEWTLELAKEDKLDREIYTKWRAADISPYNTLLALKNDYPLEKVLEWKKAGYDAYKVHEFKEYRESQEYKDLKEIVDAMDSKKVTLIE